MKKIILGILFLSAFFSIAAQETFQVSNTRPFSKGILKHLSSSNEDISIEDFMQANLEYPALAVEYCIEGEVVVLVHLLKERKVDSVEVLRGIGFGCDEEAIRLILSLLSWRPSILNQIPTPSTVKFVLHFRLQ